MSLSRVRGHPVSNSKREVPGGWEARRRRAVERKVGVGGEEKVDKWPSSFIMLGVWRQMGDNSRSATLLSRNMLT